jgi:hypothetical protein
LKEIISKVKRTPVHVVTIHSDRYDTEPSQQIMAQVKFMDGFGETIQQSRRTEFGTAYMRDENGNLLISEGGAPLTARTETRWIISDCGEYGVDGLLYYSISPFFLDSWNYVNITTLKSRVQVSAHYYDALNREVKFINPQGYYKLNAYFPWFTIAKDENDTSADISP